MPNIHISYVLFMAFLWSIAAFLSSATAKPIAKFLCSRLESYLKGRNVSALASKDTSKLNGQYNELRMINDSLQNAPPNEPASDKLVEDIGKNIVQLEDFQRKKKLPEPLFSRELFESWIENEPIEDRAYVAHNRLGLIIDWCIKNKVRETKRWQLEQVSNNLAMFTGNLRKARENLQGNPSYIPYQQQVMEAEIALRANLSTAKALFAEYSSYGG